MQQSKSCVTKFFIIPFIEERLIVSLSIVSTTILEQVVITWMLLIPKSQMASEQIVFIISPKFLQ